MDPNLASNPLILPISMLGVFVATTFLVMVATTPYETPAGRLVRYVRASGRAGSPGTLVDDSSFHERLVLPLFRTIIELAARAAPSRARKTVAAELIMAGSRMNPTMFLGLQSLLMFGIPAIGLLYVLGKSAFDMTGVVVVVVSLLWGRRLPSMWLRRRIRRRQRAIDRALPYSIDLMVACLEGGLSLDATLVKLVEQTDGPMAAETRKTLQEMALGRPTAEAIRDLGDRTGAPGLKRMTDDLVQSERMGISIAQSLRTLAHDSRIQRRQHAEELARKAPIKMVPVLIFCVLPALGIVTTAPAAILLVRTLSQSTR